MDKKGLKVLRVCCLSILCGILIIASVSCVGNRSETDDTNDIVSDSVMDTSESVSDGITADKSTGITDDGSGSYGQLADDKMINKTYKLEYLENGEWKEFDLLSVRIAADSTDFWNWKTKDAGLAVLRTEEESLRIRITRRGITRWNLRNNNCVSEVEKQSGSVEFTLENGGFVSVEPNGDMDACVMVRVTEPVDETYTGNVECTSVIRLGPGVHDASNTRRIFDDNGMPIFRLKSGEKLILEEGCVLRAMVVAEGRENVAITGTGIIDLLEFCPDNCVNDGGSTYKPAIKFDTCDGIYIGDITVRNSPCFVTQFWNVKNVEVRGLTGVTCTQNSDGLNFHGVENLKISDCVLRCGDDCIPIYATQRDARNVYVNNCVLWSDIAHCINIGCHGSQNAADRHILEDIHFEGIYIPECGSAYSDYWGAFALSVGDENICRNVTFENFVVEELSDSQLFNFRIIKIDQYNPNPGYLIEGIKLKNIVYNGSNKNGNWIYGYDSERVIRGIEIEDLYINGEKMTSLAQAGIDVNEFVFDVVIK